MLYITAPMTLNAFITKEGEMWASVVLVRFIAFVKVDSLNGVDKYSYVRGAQRSELLILKCFL